MSDQPLRTYRERRNIWFGRNSAYNQFRESDTGRIQSALLAPLLWLTMDRYLETLSIHGLLEEESNGE